MKKTTLTTLALGAALALPLSAEPIENRDDLLVYLGEHLPDGQTLSHTVTVGDEFTVQYRKGHCFSDATLDQLALPVKIALKNSLIVFQLTAEFTGYSPFGGKPGCEYEAIIVGNGDYEKYDIEYIQEDGKPDMVRIPLVRQRLLGVTETNFSGSYSIETMEGSTQCDVSFVPWFENTEPSKFVMAFASQFRGANRYKNIFSSEYDTSRWCLTERFDETYTWSSISRL